MMLRMHSVYFLKQHQVIFAVQTVTSMRQEWLEYNVQAVQP